MRQNQGCNHYVLHLAPSGVVEIDKAHVAADLDVRYPPLYPSRPPIVAIVKSRGLSDAKVKELQSSLTATVKAMTGREMVYDLAQHVETFLSAHNQETVSFHEQMTQRQETVRVAVCGPSLFCGFSCC